MVNLLKEKTKRGQGIPEKMLFYVQRPITKVWI